MKFGGVSMIGETMTKSWLGSIESIELDWHEGVFVETEASPPAVRQTVHGSMPALDSPVGVYYDAKCCLCEWAFDKPGEVPLSGLQATIGHRTPDIEGVMGWTKNHRAYDEAHQIALRAFKKEKKGLKPGVVP